MPILIISVFFFIFALGNCSIKSLNISFMIKIQVIVYEDSSALVEKRALIKRFIEVVSLSDFRFADVVLGMRSLYPDCVVSFNI